MPSWIELGILAGLVVLVAIAIWLIVQGVRVVRAGEKSVQKGTVKIKIFGGNSLETAGTGGILLVVFGVLLLAFVVGVLLWMRQNQAVKAQLSSAEARYALLDERYRTLQQEHATVLANLQKSVSESGSETAQLPGKIDARLAKRLEQASLEIVDLKARLDAISKAQRDFQVVNAASQAAIGKEISELNTTIAAQSKDFQTIRAKLRTFELQAEIADVLTGASPAEFAPTTGWEFVEEAGTKGQPRKFILAMQSSLVAKSRTASLTWKITDPDQRTVKFEGSVSDPGVVERMNSLCSQRGINCLLGSVSIRPPHK
jgi:hypothetical protein